MKHFRMAAVIAAAALVTPVYAVDLTKCSGVADDAERLACYDALAKAAAPAATSQKAREDAFVRDDIIDRCQTQMGSFGASMVKVCVDEDLRAYERLQTLVAPHKAIVDRCSNQMGSFGWSMVLVCSEEDIEAERALQRMRN